jgi:hypothetical protein
VLTSDCTLVDAEVNAPDICIETTLALADAAATYTAAVAAITLANTVLRTGKHNLSVACMSFSLFD